MDKFKYDTNIINKFGKIKQNFDKTILNNIILQGNNLYINKIYLDKLVDILFGRTILKKIDDDIVIYACKYYIKFVAKDINCDKLIDIISEFVLCKNINNLKRIFIIYDIHKFNKLNLIYLKNIIEKYKIVIIGSSNKIFDSIGYHNIRIKEQFTNDDSTKYNIYYSILDDFYKRINSTNFISYTDQLSKQLNKYLYDFTFFIKIIYDYFEPRCCNIELIKLCSMTEHMIKINNTKTIYLNKLIFDILKLENIIRNNT